MKAEERTPRSPAEELLRPLLARKSSSSAYDTVTLKFLATDRSRALGHR